MRSPENLELECPECQNKIAFSLYELQKLDHPSLTCVGCGRSYLFEDEKLQGQLKLFVDLCQQLKASEEILSSSCVAVTVGENSIEVPYRLLLTRLNSKMRLQVGAKDVTITFCMDTKEKHPLTY